MIRWHVIAGSGIAFFGSLVLSWGFLGDLSASFAASAKASKKSDGLPASTAIRFVEAVSRGSAADAVKLDFACQFQLVTAKGGALKSHPAPTDPSYETCWNHLKAAHEPALTRSDIGMDVLWPSNGGLVFFHEDLDHYPASAFVMDTIGLSPPGSGLHVKTVSTKPLPNASFRLRENAALVSVPTTLVTVEVRYQDPITSPVTKAPGSYKWASTVKPARRALKSILIEWVVLSGLKKHGFPGDTAVVNLLVKDGDPVDGIAQEIVPFVTVRSGPVPGSLQWWGPEDMPGLLVATSARAASFPNLRDRVALLNRVLIIDPNQPDALTVLTRDLYGVVLRQAVAEHHLTVKDPALSMVVNEHYWNIYAQSTRTDLSLGMEMGGFDKPTTADYLYRLLPALKTLAQVRPEQLDNRFRWGAALRWNNDQDLSIEVLQKLVKDVPAERKSGKAEALLQLSWARINKVAWNRIMDDPDVRTAYLEADQALALAELPLDKFIAEYTKAYSLLFSPARDNREMLALLTEARKWFAEVPGRSQEIWNFFIGADSLKSVLDADPIFQPLLASGDPKHG